MDSLLQSAVRVAAQAPHLNTTADELVCDAGSDLNFALGWFMFAVQIPLVYMPQYWKLLQAGSHIGLSLSNCLAFCVVSWLFLLNYVCAQFDATFECCGAGQTARTCLYGLAPFLQTVTAWFGCVLNLVFYYFVFDRRGLEELGFDYSQEVRSARMQCLVGVAVHVVLALIAGAIAAATGSMTSDAVKAYGYAANVLCALLIATHWLLQMHETKRAQRVGSLSITSCVLSSLGSFITAASLYEHGGLAVSLAYIVGGVMIAIAVGYAIAVERQSGRRAGSSRPDRPEAPSRMITNAAFVAADRLAFVKDAHAKLTQTLRDPEREHANEGEA